VPSSPRHAGHLLFPFSARDRQYRFASPVRCFFIFVTSPPTRLTRPITIPLRYTFVAGAVFRLLSFVPFLVRPRKRVLTPVRLPLLSLSLVPASCRWLTVLACPLGLCPPSPVLPLTPPRKALSIFFTGHPPRARLLLPSSRPASSHLYLPVRCLLSRFPQPFRHVSLSNTSFLLSSPCSVPLVLRRHTSPATFTPRVHLIPGLPHGFPSIGLRPSLLLYTALLLCMRSSLPTSSAPVVLPHRRALVSYPLPSGLILGKSWAVSLGDSLLLAVAELFAVFSASIPSAGAPFKLCTSFVFFLGVLGRVPPAYPPPLYVVFSLGARSTLPFVADLPVRSFFPRVCEFLSPQSEDAFFPGPAVRRFPLFPIPSLSVRNALRPPLAYPRRPSV